jgi:hypothetical protein
MYKYRALSQVSDEAKAHKEANGGFNSPPPNFREVTASEWAASMPHDWTPTLVEMRQIWFDNDGNKLPSYIQVQLYFRYDGTGWGVSTSTKYNHETRTTEGSVTYYLFGCAHDWDHGVTTGRCLHRYTCKKCGAERVVDSSD